MGKKLGAAVILLVVIAGLGFTIPRIWLLRIFLALWAIFTSWFSLLIYTFANDGSSYPYNSPKQSRLIRNVSIVLISHCVVAWLMVFYLPGIWLYAGWWLCLVVLALLAELRKRVQ